MTRRSLLFLACFIVASSSAGGLAQPVGPQFQVNTYTTDDQAEPSVAMDGAGNFVVVWASEEPGREGEGYGVFGQRYDRGGTPLGEEFQVNTYTTQRQDEPSAASDPEGNFVVVWESYRQDGMLGDGIFGQRYDKAGIPLGSEFPVNTYTAGSQRSPSVSMDAEGNFVIVWRGRGLGDSTGIFGQRYDLDGNRLGEEFQINTTMTDCQRAPSVASDEQGNFVVVWEDDYPSDYGGDLGYPYRIAGQRYDTDGNRLGSEFEVAARGSGGPHSGPGHPSMASDPEGNFVVVWDYDTGLDAEVFGARYDQDGSLLDQFQANTYTTRRQLTPWVSADEDGNFVVVWESRGQDDEGEVTLGGIFGQRFDSGGSRLGREFRVNTYTTGNQSRPAVASDASGDFVVVWSDGFDDFGYPDGLDGSGLGVFGRLYAAPCEKGPSWQGSPCPGP